MRPNLYFPIEIGTREFAARLLTACIAVERGFTVAIGFQHSLFRSAPNLPAEIFLSKGTNNFYMHKAQKLHGDGHYFVACEEENFGFCFGRNPLNYNSDTLADLCDLYLCMGQDEAEYLERRYKGRLPVSITGNARVDVLRPQLHSAFLPEANAIRDKYGKFILINTNFGLINANIGLTAKEWFQRWRELGVFGSETDINKNAVEFNRFVEWEKSNADVVMELLSLLAKQSQPVIIRPHPTERTETWTKIIDQIGAPHIQVLEGTPHIPFMLAADLVVHPGCTTGVEALILDVPVISLEVGDLPVNGYYLSNKVNLTYPDSAGAFGAIERHLQGDLFIQDARPGQLEKLSVFLDDPGEKQFSAEMVVDALEKFATSKFQNAVPGPDLREVEWVQSREPVPQYYLQKFNVSEEHFQTSLKSLKSALNRFASIKAATVSEMVYLLYQ